MDANRLLSLLGAIAPIAAIIASGIQYFEFRGFQSEPTSEYGMRVAELNQVKSEISTLEKKNLEMQEFVKALDQKKAEVSELSGKLFELKSSMSDRVDVAEFTRTIFTEAKKSGLEVQLIRPQPKFDKEFYREFPFELKFRGVYPQVFTFLNRVSSMQRLIRIDEFKLRPVSSSKLQFVQLEAELELKTYSYLGSQADQIADQTKGAGK